MSEKEKETIELQKSAVPEENVPAAETACRQKSGKKKKKSRFIGTTIAKYVTAIAVAVILLWFGFTCQVREGTCAVILRFGAVREQISDAGLYFKLPWPFETVVKYDDRLQYLESKKLETTTKDKRNIILQSYVVWEIEDPLLYHNSVGVSGSVQGYINDQVFSATNSTLGGYDLTALVSLESEQIRLDEIQHEIFTRVRDNCLKSYGIKVSDVSILRLSLPDTNLESVFEQMRADRQKDIDIIMADAYLEANKITTEADKEAAQIESQGVIDAAAIKAKTEKEVAAIYAKAQSANIELYKFLTNLDSVVNSINDSTVLVVKADEYPFNILTKYAKNMSVEGDKTLIHDLNYILTRPEMNEKDRSAIISGISDLIEKSAAARRA